MNDKTPYVPPSAHELLVMVRNTIRDRAWAYNQAAWARSIPAGATVRQVRENILREDDAAANACHTTGCVCGLAVFLGEDPAASFLIRQHFNEPSFGNGIVLPSGEHFSFMERGGELLGLDGYQQAWLFDGERTLEEVTEALDMLISNPAADITAITGDD